MSIVLFHVGMCVGTMVSEYPGLVVNLCTFVLFKHPGKEVS